MIVTDAAANVYLRATARSRPRVELLSPCNGLDMGMPQGTHPKSMNWRKPDHAPARHFETVIEAKPMQSRLNSAFVAQILGQDLVTKARDPGRAQRAYARAQGHEPAQQLLRLA